VYIQHTYKYKEKWNKNPTIVYIGYIVTFTTSLQYNIAKGFIYYLNNCFDIESLNLHLQVSEQTYYNNLATTKLVIE
jgi:hypothetical protein